MKTLSQLERKLAGILFWPTEFRVFKEQRAQAWDNRHRSRFLGSPRPPEFLATCPLGQRIYRFPLSRPVPDDVRALTPVFGCLADARLAEWRKLAGDASDRALLTWLFANAGVFAADCPWRTCPGCGALKPGFEYRTPKAPVCRECDALNRDKPPRKPLTTVDDWLREKRKRSPRC